MINIIIKTIQIGSYLPWITAKIQHTFTTVHGFTDIGVENKQYVQYSEH